MCWVEKRDNQRKNKPLKDKLRVEWERWVRRAAQGEGAVYALCVIWSRDQVHKD